MASLQCQQSLEDWAIQQADQVAVEFKKAHPLASSLAKKNDTG